MKKISIFLAAVLLCGMLASCDLGEGLIAELFGEQLDIDPVIGEYYTTDGGWSTQCECTDPDHHGGYDYPMTETWIEVDYAIPELSEMEYLTVYVTYADGSVKELMSYEDLLDWDYWNGSLSVPYAPGAKLFIKAYAAYLYSDAVVYQCNVSDSVCDTYDFSWSDLPEDHDPIQGDYLHSFFLEIPLDSLSVGYNEVYLYVNATEVQLDGWVMMQSLTVNLEAVEGDLTEGDIDDIYPMPPETMPPEEMTGAPDVEETTEDVTYG